MFIAPAGTPVPFFRSALALARGAVGGRYDAALKTRLASLSLRTNCWLYITGRAAMVAGLGAIRELTPSRERREVIVPAYTCYSVPAAIMRAGMIPRLCDVHSDTLSYDLDALAQMDTSRVAAIVSSNLYGIPDDLSRLESFAWSRGMRFFDDAAQAMGAVIDGRPAGGFGDMGLYSFDKGKNVTSMEGGALTCNDSALSAVIARRIEHLPASSPAHVLKTSLKLLAYSVLLKPAFYGAVSRLPLGLGRTEYDDTFVVARYSPTLAAVPDLLVTQLDSLQNAREQNAYRILAALKGCDRLRLPEVSDACRPAWTRLPVFAQVPAERSRILASLVHAGIGATASYPAALHRVPQVAATLSDSRPLFPGAERIADSIITLPTHPYSPADIGARIREAVDAAKIRATTSCINTLFVWLSWWRSRHAWRAL